MDQREAARIAIERRDELTITLTAHEGEHHNAKDTAALLRGFDGILREVGKSLVPTARFDTVITGVGLVGPQLQFRLRVIEAPKRKRRKAA